MQQMRQRGREQSGPGPAPHPLHNHATTGVINMKNKEKISVWVRPKDKRAIDRAARKSGKSRSEYIIEAARGA